MVFSAEPAADGGLDRSRLTAVPWAALRAFKTRERVRLVLCVGGWERSARLAAVAADPGRRAAFAKSSLRVCLGDRLDGIDIDWEHPADAAQQADYGRLLAAVRAAFDAYGLVLSVAAAGWQHLPLEGVAAVNWVNLMAYHHAGVQATFDAAQADVTAHNSRGCAGRQAQPRATLLRPTGGKGEVMAYRDIVLKHRLTPEADGAGGLAFNGPATVRRKVEFARTAGLGGVMVRELGQDAPPGDDSLLGVIRVAVRIGR